jgi:hypothetical protein
MQMWNEVVDYAWFLAKMLLEEGIAVSILWMFVSTLLILSVTLAQSRIHKRCTCRICQFEKYTIGSTLIAAPVLAVVTTTLRINGIFSAYAFLGNGIVNALVQPSGCVAWTVASMMGFVALGLVTSFNDFTSTKELTTLTRWTTFIALSAIGGYCIVVASLVWFEPMRWPVYIVNFCIGALSIASALFRVGQSKLHVRVHDVRRPVGLNSAKT